MTPELQANIDGIAASFPIGYPSAVKRGRNPQWPYIALLTDYLGKVGMTHNPMGKRAYVTREEATKAAECYIATFRSQLREKLLDPRYRALRRQYGLQEEL